MSFGSPFQPRQSALWEAQSRSGGVLTSGRADGMRSGTAALFPGRFSVGDGGDAEKKAFQPALGIPYADEAGQRGSIADEQHTTLVF